MIRRLLYWAAVALLAAGCTHLGLVLAQPYRSPEDAFGRLSAAAKGIRLQTFALPDGENAPRFADPAQVSAFCLYDLSHGPVAVSLPGGDAGFTTLAVYARHDRVLYGLTSRPGAQHRLDLVLMTEDQAARRPAGATVAGAPIRVQTREPDGFVLGEVLAGTPSEAPDARTAVLGLSCHPAEN